MSAVGPRQLACGSRGHATQAIDDWLDQPRGEQLLTIAAFDEGQRTTMNHEDTVFRVEGLVHAAEIGGGSRWIERLVCPYI